MTEMDALLLAQQQRIAELETRVDKMMPMYMAGQYLCPTMSFRDDTLFLTFIDRGERQSHHLQRENYAQGVFLLESDSSITLTGSDGPWLANQLRFRRCGELDIFDCQIIPTHHTWTVQFPPTQFSQFEAVLRDVAKAWNAQTQTF